MTQAFDLKAFRDFCAGKPEGEEYPWWSNDRCALGQFGLVDAFARRDVPPEVMDAAMADPLTFSALASRLSNLIGEGGNG